MFELNLSEPLIHDYSDSNIIRLCLGLSGNVGMTLMRNYDKIVLPWVLAYVIKTLSCKPDNSQSVNPNLSCYCLILLVFWEAFNFLSLISFLTWARSPCFRWLVKRSWYIFTKNIIIFSLPKILLNQFQ